MRSLMSVMLWTSFTSRPCARSQLRSHIPSTNGRALPMCARWYTVGPQKYMRIGPVSGSSTFVLVSVSKSRIDPAQGLIARKRGDHRPELRTALLSRQRDAQRTEVAADRLQLAHERACIRIAVAALEQLAEPLERLRRIDLCRCRRLEDRARVRTRFHE